MKLLNNIDIFLCIFWQTDLCEPLIICSFDGSCIVLLSVVDKGIRRASFCFYEIRKDMRIIE